MSASRSARVIRVAAGLAHSSKGGVAAGVAGVVVAAGLAAVPSSAVAAPVVAAAPVVMNSPMGLTRSAAQSVLASSASAAALEAEDVVVPELATESSTTYRQPDGTLKVESFTEPVNFLASDGSWTEISNELVPAEGPERFVAENEANDFRARVPADGGQTPVRVDYDGSWVGVEMRDLAEGAPDIDSSTATFDEVTGADEVSYEVISTGVKEEIVLDQAPAPADAPLSYTFELTTSGDLVPRMTPSGWIEFVRGEDQGGLPAGEVVMAIPAGQMWDSAELTPAGDEGPVYSDDVAYDLAPAPSGVAGKWLLDVTPEMAWLTDPSRVYPVTIDPSVVTGAVRDCWIIDTNDSSPHCASANSHLRVGVNQNGTRYRGLLNFDLSAIPSNATVSSAEVNLYLNNGYSSGAKNAADYGLRRVGQKWGGGPTWQSTGDFGAWNTPGGNPTGTEVGTKSLTGTETDGYQSFGGGVTGVVQNWVSNVYPNNGFIVKRSDESLVNPQNNGTVLWFRSSSDDLDNTLQRAPYLRVVYTEPTDTADAGDRSFWSYAERKLTDQITAKVNIGNGNLLVSAKDFTVAGRAGQDMGLTRYYNSASNNENLAGMGRGWSTSLGGSVRLNFPNAGSKDRVIFRGPSAYTTEFKLENGRYLASGGGINADLKRTTGGSEFELTWYDRSKYVFDAATGELKAMADPDGNKLIFTYGSSAATNNLSRLMKVQDTRNRAAKFNYASGMLTTATVYDLAGTGDADDVALLEWTYDYKQNNGQTVLASSRLSGVSAAIGSTVISDDPNIGARTTYDYDSQHRLTRITDARSNGNANTVGASGDGGVTTFSYDGKRVSTLTRQTDSSSIPDSVLAFTYLGDGFDDDVDPVVGDQTRAVCKADDGDPVNGIEDRDAASRTIVNGERTDVEDKTYYCVDSNDRILRVTDANLNQRSQAYTSNSNVEAADMTGTGAGEQSKYAYDSNNNQTGATSSEGSRSNATYGDGTNTHSPTAVQGAEVGGDDNQDPDDNRWEYEYDDKNNLIVAKAGESSNGRLDIEYRYCWNNDGQIRRIDPVTQTGAAANSTVPKRDTVVDGTPRTPEDRCDVQGTGQGNDTLFTYNAKGELTGVDRPAGGDTIFTYDSLSRVATRTDGRGVTTRFTYDGMGRQLNVEYRDDQTRPSPSPDQTIKWTYDLNGNLRYLDDGNGRNEMTYDELNRKTSDQVPGNVSANTTYAYDPAGNNVSVTVTGEPEPTRYTYDKVNLVTSVDDQRPGDAKITFAYDQKDKRTQTIYPVPGTGNNIIQEARYDDDHQMMCIYSFRGTGQTGTNGQSELGNAKNDCPQPDNNRLITYRGYDYTGDGNGGADNDNNPTTGTHTSTKWKITELGGAVTTYGYDKIMRLMSAQTQKSGSTIRDFSYSYDRHSNLVREKATGSTPGLTNQTTWMTHNSGDEICASSTTAATATNPNITCNSTGATTTRYAHDAAGNLTTATGGGTSSLDGLVLDYNLPGQTKSIDPPGAIGALPQAYDGVMQDRRTQSGSTGMGYGYSGQVSAQDTALGADSQRAHRELFVRDPSGDLLAMIDYTAGAAGSARYYLTDDQKSILATMSATQPGAGSTATAVKYLYEPYGETIRSWEDPQPGGVASVGAEQIASPPTIDDNPFRYISGYHDVKTGFLKFGARYYVPQLATWTQPDQDKGSFTSPTTLNPYQYAVANPVNHSDSTGRDVLTDFVGALGNTIDVTSIAYEIGEGDYESAFYDALGYAIASVFTTLCGSFGGAVTLGLAYAACGIASSTIAYVSVQYLQSIDFYGAVFGL